MIITAGSKKNHYQEKNKINKKMFANILGFPSLKKKKHSLASQKAPSKRL